MPKPSAFARQQAARIAYERREASMFAIQQAKDMMLIAAGDALGFGPERAKRLGDAFDAAFTEYCKTLIEDNKSDKDNWYTRAKIDERLKQICGEYFVPWEGRYK